MSHIFGNTLLRFLKETFLNFGFYEVSALANRSLKIRHCFLNHLSLLLTAPHVLLAQLAVEIEDNLPPTLLESLSLERSLDSSEWSQIYTKLVFVDDVLAISNITRAHIIFNTIRI